MAVEAIVLAGTRKGLFIGHSDRAREEWRWDAPAFAMEEICSVAFDDRGPSPRWFDKLAVRAAGPLV